MKISKNILKEYIKSRIRKIIQEDLDKNPQLPAMEDIKKHQYLINRLPPLKRALTSLLSNAFERYITNITIISPKPTTFEVTLINGLNFYLIYLGGPDNKKFDNVNATFIAQIAGKKYDLASMSQAEQASKRISGQLMLSPALQSSTPEDSPGVDNGAKQFGGDFGGGGGSTGSPTPNISGTTDTLPGGIPDTVGINATPEPGEEEVTPNLAPGTEENNGEEEEENP